MPPARTGILSFGLVAIPRSVTFTQSFLKRREAGLLERIARRARTQSSYQGDAPLRRVGEMDVSQKDNRDQPDELSIHGNGYATKRRL